MVLARTNGISRRHCGSTMSFKARSLSLIVNKTAPLLDNLHTRKRRSARNYATIFSWFVDGREAHLPRNPWNSLGL